MMMFSLANGGNLLPHHGAFFSHDSPPVSRTVVWERVRRRKLAARIGQFGPRELGLPLLANIALSFSITPTGGRAQGWDRWDRWEAEEGR